MPKWERKTTKEAKGGKLAELEGWASKDYGFGCRNCIPKVRTLGQLAFIGKQLSSPQ